MPKKNLLPKVYHPSLQVFTRKSVLVVLALLAVLMGLLVAPPGAKAASLSNPPWWNGTCDTNNNTSANGSHNTGVHGVVAATWSPTGDSSNALQSCYPQNSNGTWNSNQPDFNTAVPRAAGQAINAGWECVELSERYLYLQYGLLGLSADGSTLVDNYYSYYHSSQPSLVEGTSLSAGFHPTTGDVVSITWSNGGPHTAIVTGSSINSSGNGTISLFQENGWTTSGTPWPNGFLNVSGWQVFDAGNNALQLFHWLHDSTPTTRSSRTPTTRQVGRLPNGALATFKLTPGSQIAYSYQSAPGSTAWSTWANLPAINGDTPVSDPSVGLNSDGRLFVFARGSSGKIWIVTQTSASSTPTQWGTWSNFTPPFGNAMAGGPAVAVGGNGILYMVALDTNGRVWVQQQTAPDGPWGTYSQFSNPGGVTMTGEPFLAAGPDGRLCLFVRDTTGMIRIECQNGPNGPWGGYSQFSNPNGVTMAGNPIVAAGADGRLCLFVRDTTGMIRIECQNGPNGTYSGYSQFSNPSDGATMTGDPAVVAGQEDGRLYMYVLDNRGQVRPENQNGPDGTWGGYSQFSNPSGVTMTSIPAAGVDSNGEAQLFDVGSDGLMYWSHQTSADGAYVRLAPLAGGNF